MKYLMLAVLLVSANAAEIPEKDVEAFMTANDLLSACNTDDVNIRHWYCIGYIVSAVDPHGILGFDLQNSPWISTSFNNRRMSPTLHSGRSRGRR